MRAVFKICSAFMLWILSASVFASTATITVTENNGTVEVNGAGAIDLAGLNFLQNMSTAISAGPAIGQLLTGYDGSAMLYEYVGATGPATFGTGCCNSATSGSGDRFGVNNIGQVRIVVPQGYASGSSLNGTSTYTGQTLSSMGFTPGNYTYSWAGGTLVINVVAPAAVPTLSGWTQLLLALMVISMIDWHFHRQRLN